MDEKNATSTTKVRKIRALSGEGILAAGEAVALALSRHICVGDAQENAREIAFRAVAAYLRAVEQAPS